MSTRINRSKVHRIIHHNTWQVWENPQGKCPRVAASAIEDALRDRRIDESPGLVLRSDDA